MTGERFEELVEEVLEGLPAEFAERLDSITVVVEDWPTSDQLHGARVKRRQELLGLYEGVPLTKRSSWHTSKLPDKISIFRKPIEMRSRSEAETIKLVQEVVYHEIAHYFGIGDRRLDEIRNQKRRR